MTLVSSVLYVSPVATVELARNRARGLGGAIFISKPRPRYACDTLTATASTCSIQVIAHRSPTSCRLFGLSFDQNRAGIAGNGIYGGRTSACVYTQQ